MSQRVGSAARPHGAGTKRPQRTFTVRTRFSSIDDVQRGLTLMLREDGTLFVAAPNARVALGEPLMVVFTTSDGVLSIERQGVVESLSSANAFPGAVAGLLLRLAPEVTPDLPPRPEPADSGLFVEGSNNPLAGLATNMISLFADCNLEEQKDDISESYDDVPVFHQPASGAALLVAPPAPPLDLDLEPDPEPEVVAPPPGPSAAEPMEVDELIAPARARPRVLLVALLSMLAGAVVWFGVDRLRSSPRTRPVMAIVAPAPPAAVAPPPVAAAPPDPSPSPAPQVDDDAFDEPPSPPESCSVRVSSRPSGAVVWWGERRMGATPTARIKVSCGAELVLVRPRFEPGRVQVPERPEDPHAPPLVAMLERPAAELDLSSEPPGAEVWLGGRMVGRTPTALTVRRFVRFSVSLRAPGFAPWRQRLLLRVPSEARRAVLAPLHTRTDVPRR
jgi:hypothetical protein